MEQSTYLFKDKPYRILFRTKIKIEEDWVPGIIYTTLYDNADGTIWVRTEEDFFNKFKLK